ncbi:MAG: alpha/beta hydrolase [Gammaproteobacteria bacterium]|nr:alpha/beta hydrolase [Gammaproteobacteria bacterium]
MSIVAPERTTLVGAAGDIETLVELPDPALYSQPRAVAVCCHPHPLFGGAMINKVIHTVARSFVASGAVAIRFNFRGVGASAGVHDAGRGELDDLIRVAEWARARWPATPLWLGGFSFGAWMVLRAHAILTPQLLVTVAPPVGRWSFDDIPKPRCPWLVVQGSNDELVDAEVVRRYAHTLDPAVDYVEIEAADHFFHGRLHAVSDAVSRVANSPHRARYE